MTVPNKGKTREFQEGSGSNLQCSLHGLGRITTLYVAALSLAMCCTLNITIPNRATNA